MKKWYIGIALLTVGWLGQAANAPAQYVPNPLGAARVPEPMPCAAEPMPPMAPGPMNPLLAPPGPPCGTDLPVGHSSAFQTEEFATDNHFYYNVGALGLMRQHLPSIPIAVVDPINLKNMVITPGNLPVIQAFDDVSQNFNFGPKMTLGYLWGTQAVEVTGFWIPEYHSSVNDTLAGQLDQPFINPPIGFEGDNGMWIHSDHVLTTFQSSMWSAEANYRYSNSGILEAELILGVRYIDLKEQLINYTGDDDLTAPQSNGTPDPKRQAFYQVQPHNHIVGPQIGFETSYPASPCFTLGITAKAAVGVDFANIQTSLTRGNGLVGFNTQRNATIWGSQIYDVGAYLDINCMEKMRIRLGYNLLFLSNVATAVDEFNFNLATPTVGSDHGGVFFHGPSAEFEFLF